MNIDKIYGCVVLIETLPEEEVSVKGAKGVRKTWLEGYSKVKEFYLPDYRILPREGDYDGHYTGIRNRCLTKKDVLPSSSTTTAAAAAHVFR